VAVVGGGRAVGAQVAPAGGGRLPLAAVDSRQVIESTPGFADARRRVEGDVAAFRRLAERLEDSVRTVTASLEREAAAAPEARRAELGARYQALIGARGARVEALETWAAARQDSALAPYVEAARRAIEEERAASGVGLLFDLAAEGAPLAVAPGLEITDRVLVRVRTARVTPAALRPVAAPAPAAAPRPAPGGARPPR
jgi:Skp family chaperone for outer membrane proteins